MSELAEPDRVRRRLLLYVAGFDPAGPRRYQRMYAEEAARYGARTSLGLEVGALEGSGWTSIAHHPAGEVEVRHEVLAWNDIVRDLWAKNELQLLIQAWTGFAAYWRRGLMGLGRSKAPLLVVASFAPVVVSTAFVVLYLALAGAVAGAVAAVLPGPEWLGLVLFAVAVAPMPWAWRAVDRALPVGWLARGMHGVSVISAGGCPGFDRRLDQFAGRIIAAGQEPQWDEVLVVGHSMGAQLAAQAMGRAVQRSHELGRDGRLNLLTLGQLMPLYTVMTRDARYAADLKALAEAKRIGWLDVASPADAGGACGLHPLEGLDLPRRKDRPLRLSPRFHRIIGEHAFRRLQRRPLDFHFQYLKDGESDGDYEFFRLVAGPRRLTFTPEAQTARTRRIDR